MADKEQLLLAKLKAAITSFLQPRYLLLSDLIILLTTWAVIAHHPKAMPTCFSAAIMLIMLLHYSAMHITLSLKRKISDEYNMLSFAITADYNAAIILNNTLDVVYSSSSQITNLDAIWQDLHLDHDTTLQVTEAVTQGNKSQIIADIVKADRPTTAIISITPFRDKSIQRRSYTMVTINTAFDNQATLEAVNHLKLAIYKVDKYGYITHANEMFCRMFGYHREELLTGTINIRTIIGDGYNLDQSKSIAPKKNLRSWQRLVNAAGKFDEQIPILVIQKAVGDASIGYCIKLLDSSLVLKAKGIEEAWLDYSWQCFFKDSPYPVAILNQAGTIIRLNTSATQIFKQNGENILDLVAPHNQHSLEKEMQRINKMGSTGSQALKNIELRDGNRVVDLYFNKILDLNNDLYGFMLRIADVTQQHEFESNLSHTQRMQTIGYMSGSIAHDFNNILTVIIGFCDLLLLRHSMEDPSFRHVMQIKQSSTRAANLVNRLLAFSRKQTLHPQSLNLNEVFGEAYNIIKRLAGPNVTVDLDIAIDLWTVQFDPVQFEQVILNLVVNAHHAIKESGTILIKVYNKRIVRGDSSIRDFYSPSGEKKPSTGEYVAIDVIDNGTGIPPEIYDKIFDPFFTTKQQSGGTGLGLSTVYGIVRQSEGYLLFKSKLGEGTSFKILIQRYIPEIQEESTSLISQNNAADWSGTGTILLVEDEDAIRMFISSVLTSKGYIVLEYGSAQEALDKMHELPKIDLVISDVVMPGTNGPEFVEKLIKQHSSTKIMFISGYGEEVFTNTYGENRNFNFMPKPFSLKDLIEKVKHVLLS